MIAYPLVFGGGYAAGMLKLRRSGPIRIGAPCYVDTATIVSICSIKGICMFWASLLQGSHISFSI